jgi:hypothetical protein
MSLHHSGPDASSGIEGQGLPLLRLAAATEPPSIALAAVVLAVVRAEGRGACSIAALAAQVQRELARGARRRRGGGARAPAPAAPPPPPPR